MKKDEARIRTMIVGVDRPDFMHLVHNRRFDLSRFDKVGSSNRPVGILAHGIFRHQLMKGLTLLLGFRALSRRERQSDVTPCHELKVASKSPATGEKILAGQVHLEVNGLSPAPTLALLSNQRLPATTML